MYVLFAQLSKSLLSHFGSHKRVSQHFLSLGSFRIFFVEGSPAGTAGGELTLFYIGNELNIMDAIKSGVEFSYRSTHIYSRSGAAPGHKQQIGFANALTVATSTLQLAQSNPQLQSMPLLAVEPLVVELMPEKYSSQDSPCIVPVFNRPLLSLQVVRLHLCGVE